MIIIENLNRVKGCGLSPTSAERKIKEIFLRKRVKLNDDNFSLLEMANMKLLYFKNILIAKEI